MPELSPVIETFVALVAVVAVVALVAQDAVVANVFAVELYVKLLDRTVVVTGPDEMLSDEIKK